MKQYFLLRKDILQHQGTTPMGVSPGMEVTHNTRVSCTARSHPHRARKSRNGANACPDFNVILPRGIFHTPVSLPYLSPWRGTKAVTLQTSCHLTPPSTGDKEHPGLLRGWRTGVTALGDSSPKTSTPQSPTR